MGGQAVRLVPMVHAHRAQLRELIGVLEGVTKKKFDIDRLREYLKESAKAEEDVVQVLQSAKHRPSPIDGFFGAVFLDTFQGIGRPPSQRRGDHRDARQRSRRQHRRVVDRRSR